MRLTLAALCVATCVSMASAQTQSEEKQPADSQHSTGRTVLPDDNKGHPGGESSRAVSAWHAGCARRFVKEHR
jgi:hypothetical protein